MIKNSNLITNSVQITDDNGLATSYDGNPTTIPNYNSGNVRGELLWDLKKLIEKTVPIEHSKNKPNWYWKYSIAYWIIIFPGK